MGFRPSLLELSRFPVINSYLYPPTRSWLRLANFHHVPFPFWAQSWSIFPMSLHEAMSLVLAERLAVEVAGPLFAAPVQSRWVIPTHPLHVLYGTEKTWQRSLRPWRVVEPLNGGICAPEWQNEIENFVPTDPCWIMVWKTNFYLVQPLNLCGALVQNLPSLTKTDI